MFSRLDKFDEPIFEGAYIRDVEWVTYLGGVYSVGGLYTGGRINGILRYLSTALVLCSELHIIKIFWSSEKE